uniref:Ferritin n=1 Tax=Timspurckia oligopyrenoides TaxID=708627 RepID=A0A7S0ZGF5_9RHOD|mmetsp:Transcript_4113/g.7227  ORF Transcript_4113/g.7227 Transcript_4113/m.7227 type:complete len:258 (+) Transcript_4113:80-853(+)|eukprot:CAMPEP_0182445740 /NCGR_PEP_ID=MMETSP1172-20130603/3760_1 /TAXON_ID=708627 /ORGANISM="Timspurckia oligopyrenoides, Strain CCMP3278" /LENGTH=257 /DNA_ID=CAMNT_0024641559 /DNA_START=36 /DNA_END=809 /DNA_ORIENTATION=-
MEGFVSSGVGIVGVGNASKNAAVCRVIRSRKAFSASPVLSMVASEGGADDTIDFSSVNLKEAGKEFEGMIFKPEGDSGSQVPSRARVNFSAKCEAAINNQVNVEYTASYAYHALMAYFDRDTVALPGFSKFFSEQSEEERGHAEHLMKYQNRRGGRLEFKPVALPEMQFDNLDGTSDAMYAMDLHLQLEKFVYKKLLDVHATAEEDNDPEMTNFIEDMLEEQVQAIKTAADYVAQLRRIGTGHGVWHFDKELAEAEA